MYDVAIVGGGIAGISAAVYARRSNLHFVFIEALNLGGQLASISRIENYPGFIAVSGRDFMQALRSQVEHLKIPLLHKKAIGIEKNDNLLTVVLEDERMTVKAVILATGAAPQKLGIEGEGRFEGRGISYCAVCDGFFFKNKVVGVVGGGNTALEEALYLAGISAQVYLIHRRDQFRAFPSLAEAVAKTANITVLLDSVVQAYQGGDTLESIVIKNVQSGSTRSLRLNGLFVAAGYLPNTAFLPPFIQRDEKGFIVTDEQGMTSCRGVFACGDCRKRGVRQLITAASEGAVAALGAYQYLHPASGSGRQVQSP